MPSGEDPANAVVPIRVLVDALNRWIWFAPFTAA